MIIATGIFIFSMLATAYAISIIVGKKEKTSDNTQMRTDGINRTSSDEVVKNQDIESIKKFAETLQVHKKMKYDKSFDLGSNILSSIIEMIERVSKEIKSNEPLDNETINVLVKYGNVVRKLDTLFGETVFLNIKHNPDGWGEDKGAAILDDIFDSAEKMNNSIKEDIVKFNTSKAFDINVALKTINQVSEEGDSAIEKIFSGVKNDVSPTTEKEIVLPEKDLMSVKYNSGQIKRKNI